MFKKGKTKKAPSNPLTHGLRKIQTKQRKHKALERIIEIAKMTGQPSGAVLVETKIQRKFFQDLRLKIPAILNKETIKWMTVPTRARSIPVGLSQAVE